ncbi:MAG: 5-formyltetrahydrofolate cyclo-ligase [Flavitalea sp.]
MLKKEIRKIYTEKRLALSPEQYATDSDLMLRLFKQVNRKDVRVLMSYFPFHERLEFNVMLCEHFLSSTNPTLKIAHPRIAPDGINMDPILINKDSEYSQNRYNISEPQNGNLVSPKDIDLVFVPLLAFDSRGYRVGYGKGFYDRFLLKCPENVTTVGFSFFPAIDAISDISQFDVPLALCITPTRVYEF